MGKAVFIVCTSIFWDEENNFFLIGHRLQDVVHSEKRLYLVFEYLDLDLKKHMDSSPEFSKDPRLVKVSKIYIILWMFPCHYVSAVW